MNLNISFDNRMALCLYRFALGANTCMKFYFTVVYFLCEHPLNRQRLSPNKDRNLALSLKIGITGTKRLLIYYLFIYTLL